MNERIRRQIAVNNPFVFKHISNLKVRLIRNLQIYFVYQSFNPLKCVKSTIITFTKLALRDLYIVKGIDHFEDIGPCVILASPGMMQSGLSRELFESWCTDKKNG